MSFHMIKLSSAGLNNVIPRKNSDDEFEFVFGDHKMKTNNIFADFISPLVSKIHLSNPMASKTDFTEQIKGDTITDDILSKLQLLSRGASVEVKEDEIIQMQIISTLIENEELFSLINDKFETSINENNLDQYLSHLEFLYQISQTRRKRTKDFACNFINCTSIIKYIASHFYSIDERKIMSLPIEIIYLIISNENLMLKSEDSLFEFIEKLFKDKDEKAEIISFLEEIEFTELSESKLNEFIESFSGGQMTENLWRKLRKCFYTSMKNHSVADIIGKRYLFKGKLFKFNGNESNRFEGIINYLTQKCGGNVSDKGIVNVDSSSVNGGSYAKHSVDLKNCSNYFQTNNELNSWLRFDFIQNKVIPTQYSIRTRHNCDCNHPRNWVIEGSNTGGSNESEWTVLDRHEDDKTLHGVNFSCTFNIKPIQTYNEGYRYLRIRQTGVSYNDIYHFCLSALEFFGSLIENE